MDFSIIAGVWLGLGAVLAPFAYWRTFNHFQRKFPMLAERLRDDDRGTALYMAFMTLICWPCFSVPAILGARGSFFPDARPTKSVFEEQE